MATVGQLLSFDNFIVAVFLRTITVVFRIFIKPFTFTMSPLYLLPMFFMSTSFTIRDSEFKLCSTRKTDCFELTDRIDVSIPTLNQLPCLTVCTDRKLSRIRLSNPNVVVSLLLLLSGDISLNPGPSPSPINNVRMATINVRSISNKIASFCEEEEA